MPSIIFGMKFYFSFPGLLFLRREKKGEKKKGSSSGVPGIGYHMSKHLYHQPQVVKTDFRPRKTALLCSETALGGITGLLPYLKKYILPEGCMLGWYKVTFLARIGVASAQGLAWGHRLPLPPRPL